MRHLFYIAAEDANGTNLDLLVWAIDRAEAKKLWAKHFEGWDTDACRIGQVPGVQGYAPSRPITWDLFSMMDMP